MIHSLNTELQGNHKREVKGIEVSCLHHCSNGQLLLMHYIIYTNCEYNSKANHLYYTWISCTIPVIFQYKSKQLPHLMIPFY